jgi:hypothetical protein
MEARSLAVVEKHMSCRGGQKWVVTWLWHTAEKIVEKEYENEQD